MIGRDLKGGKAMGLTWSHFSCMSRMSQGFPKEAISGIVDSCKTGPDRMSGNELVKMFFIISLCDV